MPLDWTDPSELSFNSLLLLEQVQLSWFPGWLPDPELVIALQANPVVEWYLRHKCPALNQWLDDVKTAYPGSEQAGPARVRQAELAMLNAMMDLAVYATDPAIYDQQPFLNWDSDNEAHQCLVEHGFNWRRFTEPKDGVMRNYWLRKADV